MSDTTIELKICDWCSNEFNPEEAEDNGNHAVDYLCLSCQDDAYSCEDCGEIISSDYSCSTVNGIVCERCRDRRYYYCEPCGEYYHDNDPCDDHQNEDGDWDIRYDNGPIHDYSYRPTPKYYVRQISTDTIIKTNRNEFINNAPFMGFELEVEVNDNDRGDLANQLLSDKDDWFYLKHDGSIDYGFEIVSHPHTLSAFNLRDWSWIDWLKDKGVRSWNTDTCGLHVHINKSAFKNNGHIWRFTNLVLYNRNQASRLAGRRDNRWASFTHEYKKVGKILKRERNAGRYTAVNLSNSNTIEVRMFRGSLHEPRLRSALEFVNANFEYTKSLTSYDVLRNDAMSWWAFTTWVQANESTYPNLMMYLNRIKERSDRVSTML